MEGRYFLLLEAYRVVYLKIHGEGAWMSNVFGGDRLKSIPNYEDYIIYVDVYAKMNQYYNVS